MTDKQRDQEQWDVCKPYAELAIAVLIGVADIAQSRAAPTNVQNHFLLARAVLDEFERRQGWGIDSVEPVKVKEEGEAHSKV